MKSFFINALAAFSTVISLPAMAQANPQGNPQISAPDSEISVNARQDPAALKPVIEQFLNVQTSGSPNKISVELGRIDPRLNLAACPAPEAFLPKGSRMFGKTMIGVRCTAPTSWSIYVPVMVKVSGDYYVTAGSMAQGQVIGPLDLRKASGDLTALPAGVITDPAQAIGRTTSMAMRAGVPLRQDELRNQLVVRQGQTVKVVNNGLGFQVSVDAVATSNASEGQIGQARTATGQVVSGVAKAGGILEVNN